MSTAVLPASITKALERQPLAIRADRLAKALAETMATIHGGEFRIQLDHEHVFVMVVQRPHRTSKS